MGSSVSCDDKIVQIMVKGLDHGIWGFLGFPILGWGRACLHKKCCLVWLAPLCSLRDGRAKCSE